VIYPLRLWASSGKRWDAVHICDQSNAVYRPWVRGHEPSITCHDLLAIQAAEGRFPEHPVGRMGKRQQRWIKKNLLRIRRIVCVSGKTAEDLRAIGVGVEVVVIHNPLNNEFAPSSEAEVKEMRKAVGLRSREPYILQLGGNLWYKNRPGVVRIFTALVQRAEFADLRLIMVGHPFTAELRAEVRRLGMEERVIEIKDPADATVRVLYTGAELLLFASLREGFGWPILEAQSCGCPVATSNREPMPEVAGDAAIFVDPCDPEAAAARIAERWPQRDGLREAGFRNLLRFGEQELMAQYEKFFQGQSV
jgi:glycosyltransferase involved in cell wall biosynthesis